MIQKPATSEARLRQKIAGLKRASRFVRYGKAFELADAFRARAAPPGQTIQGGRTQGQACCRGLQFRLAPGPVASVLPTLSVCLVNRHGLPELQIPYASS